jgi:hypothetical protein
VSNGDAGIEDLSRDSLELWRLSVTRREIPCAGEFCEGRPGIKLGLSASLKKTFYPEDVDTILHHLNGLPHSEFGKSVTLFATV